MLDVTPIPAFNDNYIWLIRQPESNEVFVVDPGDAAPVQRYLKEHKLTLAGILITHHHADHTGGVAQLLSQQDVPVFGPAQSPFKGTSIPLIEGNTIEVFGETFHIKEVPGHTLDHICFYKTDDTPMLFCGDTLFMAGCGRLFEGTPEQMLEAMNFFNQLPGNTKVFCAHEYTLANLAFAQAVEPENKDIQTARELCSKMRDADQPTLPSTIALEQRINPFMRSDQGAVIYAASRREGAPLANKEAVFTVIRDWKNNF